KDRQIESFCWDFNCPFSVADLRRASLNECVKRIAGGRHCANFGFQHSSTSRNENVGSSVVNTRPARLSRPPRATNTLDDPVSSMRSGNVSPICLTSSDHRFNL